MIAFYCPVFRYCYVWNKSADVLCSPAVQLTWMAYDMVALRTNPDRGSSMQKLEEASQRCRAAVCGDRDPKPEMGKHLEDAAGTHPD